MLFNNIETDRLVLKNIAIDDRNFIFSHFSDDVVNRYLFDAEPSTGMQRADEIITLYVQPEPRFQHRWIIIKKSDGTKWVHVGFIAGIKKIVKLKSGMISKKSSGEKDICKRQ